MRKATLRDTRDSMGSRYLDLTVSPGGDVTFHGLDFNVDGFGGDDEYEWYTEVDRRDVPALITALGGDPDTDDIFDLLVRDYSGSESSEPERLIRELDIPHTFRRD